MQCTLRALGLALARLALGAAFVAGAALVAGAAALLGELGVAAGPAAPLLTPEQGTRGRLQKKKTIFYPPLVDKGFPPPPLIHRHQS